MSKQDEIMQVAVLIDNLKNDEATERLNSMRQLDRIAQALGPKRAREELVQFLCSCCDDDDEILMALCEQLPRLVPRLGGDAYAHLVMEPLRLLASSDSKVVRDAAVQQLTELSAKSEACAETFGQIAEKLLESEWYNYRQSGLQMAPEYLKLNQADGARRSRALSQFQTCASDTLPMVRRQAAEALGRLAEAANAGELAGAVKTTLLGLLEDQQDAVRAVAVRAVPAFILACQRANAAQRAPELVAAMKEQYARFLGTSCADISWRVRYSCADVFSQVMEAYAGFGSLMPLVTLPRETKESREVDEPIDPWLAPKGLEEHRFDLGANVAVAQDAPKYQKGPDYDEAAAAKTFARLLGDSEAEVRCVAVQRLIRVANRI